MTSLLYFEYGGMGVLGGAATPHPPNLITQLGEIWMERASTALTHKSPVIDCSLAYSINRDCFSKLCITNMPLHPRKMESKTYIKAAG